MFDRNIAVISNEFISYCSTPFYATSPAESSGVRVQSTQCLPSSEYRDNDQHLCVCVCVKNANLSNLIYEDPEFNSLMAGFIQTL